MTRRALCATGLAAALLPAACVTPPEPLDYGPYVAHMPRSILVLPPLNQSVEVQAPESLLSCVTVPLAELGYYVFPVAVVQDTLRQNGVPEPAEMHQVPPDRLRSVFGCDAVLYLDVTEWGTEYQVLNSATTVAVQGRLVDAATGTVLWTGAHAVTQNSASGASDPVGMLFVAVVQQVVNTASDAAHGLARFHCPVWLRDGERGLLPGPRLPGWETDPRRPAAATTR